jgi:hypothetical protein
MNPGRIYSMIKCFGLGSFKKNKKTSSSRKEAPLAQLIERKIF